MTYREVARKLMALKYEQLPRQGGGSHRKWHNPATHRISILPDWGSSDLKIGTIRAVVKQLGIEWNDFSKA